MKNLVCMINLKSPGQADHPFVANTSFAWKKWCDKNGVDFLMWEDPLYDVKEMSFMVQQHYLLDMLEANGLSYDQIAQVNYDTFPMYYCPNFFEMTDGNYTVVADAGEPHQLNRSIRMVRENWYPEITEVKWENYFNSGFVVYGKKHKDVLMEVINFFKTEKEKWCRVNKSPDYADDQTIMNFAVRKYKHAMTYLPRSFNVLDHWMRCIFFEGEDSNRRYISNLQTIKDCVNIFHFTGNNDVRNQLTSYLLHHLADKYE